MARINKKQVCQFMAYEMKKTPRVVESYINEFIKLIIKEVNRGNEIRLDGFCVIKPKFRGGIDKYVFGDVKYIDPRIGVEMVLTENGVNKLNKQVVNIKTKNKAKSKAIEERILRGDISVQEALGDKVENLLELNRDEVRKVVREYVDITLIKKGLMEAKEDTDLTLLDDENEEVDDEELEEDFDDDIEEEEED